MNLKDYLNDLIEKGLLRKEDIGIDQTKSLLKNAFKNLQSARKNLNLDEETCYTMAYNAMIKVARAILFLNNFRPVDGYQHKTTIDAAGRILGKDFNGLIIRFDKMRKKRNIFTYEPLIPLSKEEAGNSLKTAEEFYKTVRGFLENKNPQLKLF